MPADHTAAGGRPKQGSRGACPPGGPQPRITRQGAGGPYGGRGTPETGVPGGLSPRGAPTSYYPARCRRTIRRPGDARNRGPGGLVPPGGPNLVLPGKVPADHRADHSLHSQAVKSMAAVLDAVFRRYRVAKGDGPALCVLAEGFDCRTQCPVVLKFCYNLSLERCHLNRRALRRLRRLRHPNVVPLMNYVFAGDHTLVHIMERQSGPAVADVLARAGQLDRRQAIDVVLAAARGLQALHREGILHGDVACSNLLYHDGLVRLADFDLAILIEDATRQTEGCFSGTPEYTAPELASAAAPASPLSDLYALGCVYYELLTGKPPFMGGSALHVLYLQVEEPPPDPRKYRPELSEEELHVLNRLLAKRPSERYPSSDKLIEDLVRVRATLLALGTEGEESLAK
ncbi:MAG: hypothetical protein KatS3mg027_0028 [Bacteroidia bacterium]|nr:MAG: hypothetical protein KatS3mg027_0028 [Bacteroidia bacterium]